MADTTIAAVAGVWVGGFVALVLMHTAGRAKLGADPLAWRGVLEFLIWPFGLPMHALSCVLQQRERERRSATLCTCGHERRWHGWCECRGFRDRSS